MHEKVLIVDDTPASMSKLVDLLERSGYMVSAAPNGVVALNVAGKLAPDLILLDVVIPELDGLETCRRLKSNPLTADVPVLFISSRDDAATMIEGFRAGAADYVVEPFQPEVVLARVHAHLRLSLLTRELRRRNAELTAAHQQLQKEIAGRQKSGEMIRSADQRLPHIAQAEAHPWATILQAPARESHSSPPAQAEGELPMNLEKVEALMMERALAQTSGNVARAARLLGINRSRIYRKFKKK